MKLDARFFTLLVTAVSVRCAAPLAFRMPNAPHNSLESLLAPL